jgi:hypothetical protein
MSTLLKKIAPSLNVYAAEPITEAMVAAAVSAASTYTIEFDFRSAAEKAILTDLQKGKYQLLAYKGASGPSQVTAGLPTWFAMPFTNIYGDFKVNYTPVYKVYVYNEVDISEDTVITMDALSQEVTLGTALTFQPDGSFKIASSPAQPGAIKLTNNRPGGTTNQRGICAFLRVYNHARWLHQHGTPRKRVHVRCPNFPAVGLSNCQCRCAGQHHRTGWEHSALSVNN